jgi:hypothetical protein
MIIAQGKGDSSLFLTRRALYIKSAERYTFMQNLIFMQKSAEGTAFLQKSYFYRFLQKSVPSLQRKVYFSAEI